MNAIYARQSIDKADSLSIDGQIALCRRQIDGEAQIYQDRGYSGKNTKRPAFQRMMGDVEKGKISKIVVYRLDRFSRSLADFSRLWETLQQHGVAFVSVNETFDTATPMGRAMLNIIMIFAQLERETTAQRVQDNYYQRAALGYWPGGPAPYGFSLCRLPDGHGRTLPSLAADAHAPEIMRIFTRYAQPDATLGLLARELNQSGVPAPKRAVWDSVSLSRLLHSPLYAMANADVCLFYQSNGIPAACAPDCFDGRHGGMLVGKRSREAAAGTAAQPQRFSPASHLGLVPAPLWLQCQYKLAHNRQLGNRGKGKHSWLSGLLKCAVCGYSIKINHSAQRDYLLCSGRSNLGVCSQSLHISLPELEQAVSDALEQLLKQCPLPQGVIEQPTGPEAASLDEKIQRLVSALAQSTKLSAPYIREELERLSQQRAALLQALPPQKQEAPRICFQQLRQEEKKLVANLFIREIRLRDDQAEVFWRV